MNWIIALAIAWAIYKIERINMKLDEAIGVIQENNSKLSDISGKLTEGFQEITDLIGRLQNQDLTPEQEAIVNELKAKVDAVQPQAQAIADIVPGP